MNATAIPVTTALRVPRPMPGPARIRPNDGVTLSSASVAPPARPARQAEPPRAARLQDFEGLAQLLISGIGGPVLASTGALLGFLLGGPALGLTLATAGGSLPALLFGGYDVVVGTGDILAGRKGGKGQLALGLALLVAGPGLTWAGASLGAMLGTASAATLGAMLAPALLFAGPWIFIEVAGRLRTQA
ncbi:MAG: hypothetical protein FJY99_01470 [Candidatus Sericytochromatia bacterium]|nr:hypothetical protein [Candidatus Tanganyikabacteria bacterium]